MRSRLFILILALGCSACASYYQVNQKFNRLFEDGELEKADKVLEDSKKASEGRAKLLYYMNRGVVTAMLGEYEESNRFFEKAYTLGEDLRNNYWNIASSYLVNPLFANYTGEDHELLLIHYYKALNYLQMGNTQEALVECRRLNIKLTKFADRYPAEKGKPKYHRDAFIHTLMGLIYDANHDYNNAFIAYRNAVDIYREDYLPLFGLAAPAQLQQDLLRTAHLMKFDDEQRRYEKLFNTKYKSTKQTGGELVFFWNNGLGPVKDEWSINFALVPGASGLINFQNQQYGWNFPFYLESDEEYEKKGLNDLKVLRVAFPKYEERPLLYQKATIKTAQGTFPLHRAEDINGIAFQSLQQRMLQEFGKSLLRLAVKKAAEYGVREKNDDLGALVGVMNALTERADTRNWQTIPHSIYYTRVPLPVGEQTVTLKTISQSSSAAAQSHNITVTIRSNQTTFSTFHSLDATRYPLISDGAFPTR